MSEIEKKRGRPPSAPVVLSEEQKTIAINMAAEGKALKQIIDAICMPEYAFLNARRNDHNFEIMFEEARQEGLEHHADSLLVIANEEVDVQRGRLKSDNIKWLLSKRKPKTYGDRIDVTMTQTVDIRSALAEAQSRILVHPSPRHDVIEVVNNNSATRLDNTEE